MTYILAETKTLAPVTRSAVSRQFATRAFLLFLYEFVSADDFTLLLELYAIYCGKSIMCIRRNLVQQTENLNNSYLH